MEFNRALHPNAVLQIRYNKSLVQEKVIQNIYGFFILYMLSFILGALGFSILGLDFVSSIGVAASSLGNVGPALGDFGPSFFILCHESCWEKLGLFFNADRTPRTLYRLNFIYALFLGSVVVMTFPTLL